MPFTLLPVARGKAVANNPTRVHELARELGVSSKEILQQLSELGEFVKSASSRVEAPVARRLREIYRQGTVEVQLEIGETSTHRRRVRARPRQPAPSEGSVDETRVSAIPDAVPRVVMHRIEQMAHWHDVEEVISACRKAVRESLPLVLDVSQTEAVFPNGCVPIAAVVEHYKQAGLSVSLKGESGRVLTSSFRNPIEATVDNLAARPLMNKVWVYLDEDQVGPLTNALIHLLQKTVEMEDGVQDALNFCLYEVLDNVFQHSGSRSGFFMANVAPRSKRLSLAIADTGIGVFNSFKPSKYNPPSHFDALTLAIQSGVTSTGDKRGNGLYALKGTVERNRGRLILRSGPGHLAIVGDKVTGNDRISSPVIDRVNQGFFLDWQLQLDTPVSLDDVLGMGRANFPLENLENDDGEHVIFIADHEAGTGTRKAAEQLRLFLVNSLHLGAPYLVLDFTGVTVVSASFADEVIGKLADEYGMIRFPHHFRLRSMNQTIANLLDRAIRLRVSTEPPTAIERER
jgi:hypothetical protein